MAEAHERRRSAGRTLEDLRRLWTVAGRRFYFPSLITVWHVEPGGHDSGEVCKHYRRDQSLDGKWETTWLRGWKWHVHHWHLQVHPLQNLRRWALTRCAWCGGRSAKANRVDTSRSWDGPRGRWWQGEPGLFHGACMTVENAHRFCACAAPRVVTDGHTGTWVECAACQRLVNVRPWRELDAWQVEHRRLLHQVPTGTMPTADIIRRAREICAQREAP
jgi:hypothetical protein